MRYRPKDIIDFFRNIKDEKTKRKISIFAICLFISFFIWLIVNLSKKYESTIHYPIVYSGVPGNEAFIAEADSVLSLRVRATGFRILYLKYLKVPPPLNVNLKHSLYQKQGAENEYFLPTSSIGSDVNAQLNENTSLLGISPDTIGIVLQKVETKKIPVQLNYEIEITGQYKPYGPLKITPDSVSVSGKNGFLDTIDYVPTEKLIISDVSQTRYNLALNKKLVKSALYISDMKVKVDLNLEKYTEEKQMVPIQVLNKPDSVDIKLFPDEVEVSYFVAIKDYDKIITADFAAIIDFKELSKERSFAKVILEEIPEKIEVNRVAPGKVEFILIRND